MRKGKDRGQRETGSRGRDMETSGDEKTSSLYMTNTLSRAVAYLRVSTSRQGRSGLGLEVQRRIISDYLASRNWEQIEEFVEIESGRKDDREQLMKALRLCQITGATLIIAKLDRLSRDAHFIGSVMKSNIDFVACDLPEANKFTISIFAALAEHERELISQRTRDALHAAKDKGRRLGTPANLTKDAADRGRSVGNYACTCKANKFAADLQPLLREYLADCMSMNRIATELNNRGILTPRGSTGRWTARAVINVLARLSPSEQYPDG